MAIPSGYAEGYRDVSTVGPGVAVSRAARHSEQRVSSMESEHTDVLEQERQAYIATLREAQANAERAVIEATLRLGEAVDALYAVERNIQAEGVPVEPPDRVPGPAIEAVRQARCFWREWYPQLAGAPAPDHGSGSLQNARKRLARAMEGLRKAEEAGEDKACLASWRETVALEARNVAYLESQGR